MPVKLFNNVVAFPVFYWCQPQFFPQNRNDYKHDDLL